MVADQALRHHPALAQQQRVAEPRRDLLHVMGHQHQRRGVRVLGQPGQPPHQLLPAAQIEPGRRLVEQQQFGVGHQRPGDLDPLALTLRQRPVVPLGQRRPPRADAAARAARAVSSRRSLPEPPDHAP